MDNRSDKKEQSDGYALDQEAQRRREAGADGAEADKLPEPGPSRYKDAKDSEE